MTMLIVFSALFALFVAFLVLSPFFAAAQAVPVNTKSQRYQNLYDQRDRCLQVLGDLELDFTTSKLSEEEYQEMKRSVSLELARILKQIDAG